MRLEEVVTNRKINWYVEPMQYGSYTILSITMILHGRTFHTHVNAN